MRTSNTFEHRGRRGYVLVMTLTFLAVSLIALSSIMYWASSSGNVTQRNELFTTAEAAAEAGTEVVVATLDRDWTYGQTLQAPGVYQNLIPAQTGWPMQFQYGDGSGNNNLTGLAIGTQYYTNMLGSSFTNLAGYVTDCVITSVATTIGQFNTVSATVQQQIHATIIPLFQFAIFYNMNLEIDPGAAMSINGPVFSNQSLWSGTGNITYNSTVQAAGWAYTTNTADPWASGKTDTGTPLGNFTAMPKGPLSKQDSLSLPVGTNNSPAAVEAIINLPPGTNGAPNAWAYTTNGQMYLFNAADLIISNAASGLAGSRGTNITIWYQDPNNVKPLTQVSNDFYALKTGGSTNVLLSTGIFSATNVAYSSYSFVTNVQSYDFRESDTNQLVQVDISRLNTWLTNKATTGGNQYNKTSFANKGHGINSMFIYNNVPQKPSQLPSVRLVNGAQLPSTTDPNGTGATTSGLTVATPQPLYVKGDYNVQTAISSAGASALTTNTANTYPAAIMGDSISILSANWNDANSAYQKGGLLANRATPSATTINAACLEGIVQSINSNYSGGVENFLRLQEDWGATSPSVTLQYNGSIVVMFPSQYATNYWPGTGSVYNPPTRKWAFDLNFTNPNKLPPLTPKFYKMIRFTWNAY